MAYPGRTCDELWKEFGAYPKQAGEMKELQEVRRRMSDLWQAAPPRVRRGDSRKCIVKGTLMYVWYVT